jgi:peptidoglycan-N-acetylglucosamine deacetylase
MSRPRVYLTFDDGPDPVWTPRIIDALEAAGARATFFVTAPRAVAAAELLARTIAAGHGVEFHCSRHDLHSRMRASEVEADLRDGLAVLAELGIRPRRWRPPWGVSTPSTVKAAALSDVVLTGWSADPEDWRGDPPAVMLARLDGWLRPGCVVVMHDALGPGARRDDCAETVHLIEPLVAAIRAMGAEPASLPEPDGPENASVWQRLHQVPVGPVRR